MIYLLPIVASAILLSQATTASPTITAEESSYWRTTKCHGQLVGTGKTNFDRDTIDFTIAGNYNVLSEDSDSETVQAMELKIDRSYSPAGTYTGMRTFINWGARATYSKVSGNLRSATYSVIWEDADGGAPSKCGFSVTLNENGTGHRNPILDPNGGPCDGRAYEITCKKN